MSSWKKFKIKISGLIRIFWLGVGELTRMTGKILKSLRNLVFYYLPLQFGVDFLLCGMNFQSKSNRPRNFPPPIIINSGNITTLKSNNCNVQLPNEYLLSQNISGWFIVLCSAYLLFVSVSGMLTCGIFLVRFTEYFQVSCLHQ